MPEPVTPVSIEEYLRTSYEGPDREYVDGIVLERNVGEKSHSRMQRQLIEFFGRFKSQPENVCLS